MAPAGGALAQATSTTLTSSETEIDYGDPATLSVRTTGSNAVTGTVTFSSGSTTLGSVVLDSLGNGFPMAATYSAACVMASSGGVKCWGNNNRGQLGDGTITNSMTPVDVIGLPADIVAIRGDTDQYCVVTGAGRLLCWGRNDGGQLGDGTTTDRSTPADVTGLTGGISAVATAEFHTCALTDDGGVKCWGSNAHGRLGDGTTTDSLTPVDVVGLQSGVSAIGLGAQHSCAALAAGGVKCWGRSDFGQRGDGTTADSSVPVDVVGLSDVVVALDMGNDHTCALTEGGAVYCWGQNTNNQIGDGTTTNRYTPVQVNGLSSGVVAIRSGSTHTCALTDDGGIKCWGRGNHGKLGYGGTANRSTPVDVSGLTSGVSALEIGGNNNCAITDNGELKCWGHNFAGQLGDGTTTSRSTPVDATAVGNGVAAIFGDATFSTAALLPGDQTVTAVYGGDEDDNVSEASASLVVTTNTTTALETSSSSVAIGETVTFTATVEYADGAASGSVVFKKGGTTLATETLADGSASFSTDALAVGDHTIKAKFTGDTGFENSRSDTIDQAIEPGETRTSLSVSDALVKEGQSQTFTAAVKSVAPASGTADGSVSFLDGSTVLGTVALVDGAASLAVELGVGRHKVKARYEGTSDWTGSASSRVAATVTAYVDDGETKLDDRPSALDQEHGVSVPLAGGGYVIVWQARQSGRDGYSIRGRRFKAAGRPAGRAFRVTSGTNGNQILPVVTGLKGGGFVVAWAASGQDGSGYGIYARRYDSKARPVGREFRVSTRSADNQTKPSIGSLGKAGFVVVWQSTNQDAPGLGIYAQRFNRTGGRIGTEFLVNSYTRGDQSEAVVTALAKKRFAVSWTSQGQDRSGSGVYAQRFTAQGKRLGGELRIAKRKKHDQRMPALAPRDGGGFVAVWASKGQDGSGSGVYARRFDARGKARGGEIPVNSYTKSHQSSPVVESVADGGFVVVWTSAGQDGSGTGIYAQRFDESGSPVDEEFRVNRTTKGVQRQPAIVSTQDGTLVVTWTGQARAGGRNVLYGSSITLD